MKTAMPWLKFSFSAALLVLIIYKLNSAALWQSLTQVSSFTLLLALLLQLSSTLIAAYRWRLIQDWLGSPSDTRFYLRSYFKGTLFNQLLPTSIGGDAYRIIENGQRIANHKEAFFGVFIDRIAGLLGLLLLNAIALTLLPTLLPPTITYTIVTILSIGFIGALIGLWLHRLPHYHLPLWSSLQTLSARFARVYHSPRYIVIQLGLSVIIHLCSMLVLMTLGHALGLAFNLWTYLVIIPPVILLTLLPLSFAGWGIREGAMVGLFSLIGASNETTLAMSLLYGLILIIGSLPGLWFFIQDRGFFNTTRYSTAINESTSTAPTSSTHHSQGS